MEKGWEIVTVSKDFWKDHTEICSECERKFNMLNVTDNEEWFYGHDCEAA
jgi:hypothetical protein